MFYLEEISESPGILHILNMSEVKLFMRTFLLPKYNFNIVAKSLQVYFWHPLRTRTRPALLENANAAITLNGYVI